MILCIMEMFKLKSLNQVHFNKFQRSIKQHGHCNDNHKAKLDYMTPKLVHPFVHAPRDDVKSDNNKCHKNISCLS